MILKIQKIENSKFEDHGFNICVFEKKCICRLLLRQTQLFVLPAMGTQNHIFIAHPHIISCFAKVRFFENLIVRKSQFEKYKFATKNNFKE